MFLDASIKMKVDWRIRTALAFLVLIVFLTACNSRSQSLPDYEKDTLPDNLIPPEPGPAFVIVEDARSDGDHAEWMSLFISGGVWADTWFVNQYERPFTPGEMIYQPYLDILQARIRPAGDWSVFEIETVEAVTDEKVYIALEFDLNLDNRPDLLVLTRAIGETVWNDSMIALLEDQNLDVGGNRLRLAEPGEAAWDGFDNLVETEASKNAPLAYVRRSPVSTSTYQIAVLNTVLGSEPYVWRVWLEGQIFHPGWYEYHDRYSLEQAGSPYLYSTYYPLKKLASIDNTCLHLVGGELTMPKPGHCGTITEITGDFLLPPDDLFTSPVDDENPIAIVFPEDNEEDDGRSPESTLIPINPGYFLQATPTPQLVLSIFSTLEFVIPPDVKEEVVVLVPTPINAVVVPQEIIEAIAVEPTPVEAIAIGPTETDLFDPYAGSTPVPTDLFDPYQGYTPTPIPINPNQGTLSTPTPSRSN